MDHHWLVFHCLHAVQYGQSQYEYSNPAHGKAIWMGHSYHWHCTVLFLLVRLLLWHCTLLFLLVCLLLLRHLDFQTTACFDDANIVILAELVRFFTGYAAQAVSHICTAACLLALALTSCH